MTVLLGGSTRRSDKNMKLKLARLTVFFAAVLLIITSCFFFTNQKQEKAMEKDRLEREKRIEAAKKELSKRKGKK